MKSFGSHPKKIPTPIQSLDPLENAGEPRKGVSLRLPMWNKNGTGNGDELLFYGFASL